MGSVINFAEVPSDLSKWIKKNDKVFTGIFADGQSYLEYFRKETEVMDRWTMNNLRIADIVQPGGKRTGSTSFHPTANAIKPVPRIGEVKKCKVDLLFDEEDTEKLWKSYLAEVERRTKAGVYDELPYQLYFMEMIIKKAKENVHKKALYKGVFNASGSAAVDIFDGINTQAAALITATTIPAINVFAGAAITQATAIAQFNGVVNLVPFEYMNEDFVIVCAPENWKFYSDAYVAANGTYPINPSIVTDGVKKFDKTNWTIIPEIGLTGSDKIYVTPKENFEIGMNGEGDIENVTIEYSKRDMLVMVDFRQGVGISAPDFVWTNDQA